MHTTAVTSIQPSKRLATRSSIVSIMRRKRKVPPPPERAVYKPPPWWTIGAAFAVSVALHIGAVAALETGGDGRLAKLWETRILAGDEIRTEERGNN